MNRGVFVGFLTSRSFVGSAALLTSMSLATSAFGQTAAPAPTPPSPTAPPTTTAPPPTTASPAPPPTTPAPTATTATAPPVAPQPTVAPAPPPPATAPQPTVAPPPPAPPPPTTTPAPVAPPPPAQQPAPPPAIAPAPAAPANASIAAAVPPKSGLEITARLAFAYPILNEGTYDAGSVPMSQDFGVQIPLIVEVGWRASKRWFLGGYAGLAYGPSPSDQCDLGGTCRTYDFRIGVIAHYHFRPDEAVDPWVGFGLGWEVSRLNVTGAADDTGTTYDSTQGITGPEIPLMGGVDFRLSDAWAAGPFLAAHVAEYLSYDTSGGPADSAGSIPGKTPHIWLMAGGRVAFDP